MDNPIQDVIKFFSNQATMDEEGWTLSGSEARRSEKLHNETYSCKRYAAPPGSAISLPQCSRQMSWQKRMIPGTVCMIQFKTEPGADHQDPTHVF